MNMNMNMNMNMFCNLQVATSIIPLTAPPHPSDKLLVFRDRTRVVQLANLSLATSHY